MTCTLITTPIEISNNKEKKIIFLGEWCKKKDQENIWKNLESFTHKHHWVDQQKLYSDREKVSLMYEKILKILSNKLNLFHKVNLDLKSWRIILGPWLTFYTVCIFDKWETLRVFFDKNTDNKEVNSYEGNNEIFYNFGTEDFWKKATLNDFWQHKNFLRIIESQHKDKIKINKIENNISFPFLRNKTNNEFSNKSTINPFQKTLLIFENFFSSFGLRFNTTIIESFYGSKLDLLKILIKSKIFPCFYLNSFKFKFFEPKNHINLDVRRSLFSDIKEELNVFEKYIFSCLITDFPIAYLEKFNEIDNLNKSINNLKKKSIFTMTSYVFNERFKIWLARMINKGAKLNLANHGGCFPYKVESFLDHDYKIADKCFTWFKPFRDCQKQASAIQLIKSKNITRSQDPKLCLVISCDVLRYPMKFQSCPYVEQSKDLFDDTCSIIKNLKMEVYKNVVYRCYSKGWGFDMPARFLETFRDLEVRDLEKKTIYEDFKNTKLVISTYPDTVTAESIMANIPTIITFSTKLYHLAPSMAPILETLKKNNIFFDNPESASNHINKIWSQPDDWWKNKSTQNAIGELKNYAFNVNKDWIDEWSKIFKGGLN